MHTKCPLKFELFAIIIPCQFRIVEIIPEKIGDDNWMQTKMLCTKNNCLQSFKTCNKMNRNLTGNTQLKVVSHNRSSYSNLENFLNVGQTSWLFFWYVKAMCFRMNFVKTSGLSCSNFTRQSSAIHHHSYIIVLIKTFSANQFFSWVFSYLFALTHRPEITFSQIWVDG